MSIDMLSPVKRWFLSTDEGKTWNQVSVHPRSLVTKRVEHPGAVYDDGFGNQYRYEVVS